LITQKKLHSMKALILPFLLCFSIAAGRADSAYHFIKEIPMGGDGGWDYLSVDSAAHRLYVSHATKVVVIDLKTDQIIGEITNVDGVHGLAPASELGCGLVTCGRENQAAIVDLQTLQTIKKIPTGGNPDGMLYEPGRREFYTFNGRGESATVIDAQSRKLVATIPLGGKPEFAQADPGAGRVYDNLENKNAVAVIDTKHHRVVQRWPVAPGEAASGMAIDLKDHRLFIGCDNQLMVMMNSENGKVLASVPIGEGVDATAFDPGTGLAFASCGRSGTTTIAHADGDQLTVVQTLKTEPGARTMALDPATHKIYLATAKMEPRIAGQRRGRMVPGSFKVLVYGM
jgi:DNA-binding beta-propeller fold protein YncE